MNALRNIAVAAVIGGAVALVLLLVSDAGASVYYGWKWQRPDTRPIRIAVVVDQQFDPKLMPQLKDAARAWEATKDFKLDVARKPVPSCDPIVTGVICVSSNNLPAECAGTGGCAWTNAPDTPPTDGSPWVATFGRVWINEAAINPADTRFKRHAFCHELGHTLGLGHPEDGPPPYQPSCMSNDYDHYYSDKPGSDDLALLHELYGWRTG